MRLLGIFITLDILLGLGVAAVNFLQAERAASAAVGRIEAAGLPQEGEAGWLLAAGVTISPDANDLRGITVPSFLQKLALDKTIPGRRTITWETEGNTFLGQLQSLRYHAGFSLGESPFLVSVNLGEGARQWVYLFWGFGIFELLYLLGNLFWGARTVGESLRPFAELTRTTELINRAGREAFTPKEMEVLAGKIDRINVDKLDTRIPVDSAQSEIKNLALAINGMLDRINESYRAQVRFVSDASHELRTPISVIQGYANLLDRWGKNDEKVLLESIAAIKDEAANMKDLVEELLFLARGDNDTIRLSFERFDLSELADAVVKETRMIDGAHTFEARLQPVFVFADEALLKQALRILVDNAIKYTPAGGHIRIGVQQKEESARLTVQDDGIGIPAEAVPKIFDRFYRADESRARATGGAGLGLSIAQWITERHGGHMEVLSRVDLGTRMILVLPAVSVNLEAITDEKPQQ